MNAFIRCVAIASFVSCVVGCAAVPRAQSAPAAAQPEADRNLVTVLLGSREMSDDEDWSPTESQFVGELGFTTTPSDWAVGIEGTVSYSDDSSEGFEGETTEASVGVRKSFNVSEGRVHPYLGAGLGWIKAKFSGLGLSDDDTSIAGYAHGGVLFDLSQHWHLGVDVRFLFGSDITLFDVNGDADYAQYGAVLGFSF